MLKEETENEKIKKFAKAKRVIFLKICVALSRNQDDKLLNYKHCFSFNDEETEGFSSMLFYFL